jgi:hypothetical protein
MKRSVLLVVVTVLAVLAICTAAGAAGRGTFKADLSGTYSFASTQVRMTYPPGGTEKVVEYCSGYGTATFDGFMKVVTSNTERCSISGTTTEVTTRYYVEEPDGAFLVKETLEAAYATHCRMVERERTLLCDGTASDPDTLSFHAVAVKE